MKSIKKITTISLILIGLFSFSKTETSNTKTNFNIENTKVIQSLLSNEMGCRPSSELMFYVETSLVKKYRGFKTVNANIYVFDRVTGQSNLLVKEDVIISNYDDSVLGFDVSTSDYKNDILKNGDKILNTDTQKLYCFNELIKNEVIYSSYIRSTNKLLKINRVI